MFVSVVRRPFAFAKRLARDEQGTITVEAVLWIPLFFFILMLITDASMAFFSKGEAIRTVQMGNWAFARNPDATVAGTQDWIEQQFAAYAPNAEAITTTDSEHGTVSTTLQYPAGDVVPFNTLGVLGNWKIAVRARQHLEWEL